MMREPGSPRPRGKIKSWKNPERQMDTVQIQPNFDFSGRAFGATVQQNLGFGGARPRNDRHIAGKS